MAFQFSADLTSDHKIACMNIKYKARVQSLQGDEQKFCRLLNEMLKSIKVDI